MKVCIALGILLAALAMTAVTAAGAAGSQSGMTPNSGEMINHALWSPDDVTLPMKGLRTGGRPVSGRAGFILTLTVLVSLLMITLSAQLPAGIAPAWLRTHKAAYGTVWPQGWSFFANAPDVDTLSAYRLGSGRIAHGSVVELSMSGRNLWGLGRTAQAQLNEALYLADLVPRDYWNSCAHPLARSCLGAARVYRLTNVSRPAVLCGLIAFVHAEPSATASPTAAGRSELVTVTRVDCGG